MYVGLVVGTVPEGVTSVGDAGRADPPLAVEPLPPVLVAPPVLEVPPVLVVPPVLEVPLTVSVIGPATPAA